MNHKTRLIKVFGFALMGLALLTVSTRLSVAQTQTPSPTVAPVPVPVQTDDVKQLKERLQQLEETVLELKAKLDSIDAARSTTAPDYAQAKLETNGPTPVSDPTVAKQADNEKKGESSFQVYGFAMLDAGYQVKQADPNWFDTVRPVKLPDFKDQFAPNGNTYFSVRQTRFGVKSSTPTKYGAFTTKFEFELFGTGGDAGQTTFRLRHAYGELGHFGAGQNWSTFVDPDVFPNTNEYWGPNGLAWFRNVQFRWMPLQGKNSITIAAERPGASADLGRAADRNELQGVKPKFPAPDLAANVRFDRGWGHVQISGLVRYMKWVDTTADAFDLSGSATGAGIGVTSNLNLGKKDVAKLSFNYGHGIENYMNDAPVDVGIELTHSTNPRTPIRGVALPVTAMSAYLDHTWNKLFSSSIGYSMLNISNSDGQLPSAFRRGHYASANFLYYPVTNVMVGAEVIYGQRDNFLDGFKSNDTHVQFSFKYNFSKEVKF